MPKKKRSRGANEALATIERLAQENQALQSKLQLYVSLCEEMKTTFLFTHQQIKKLEVTADFHKTVGPVMDRCYEMVMKFQLREK